MQCNDVSLCQKIIATANFQRFDWLWWPPLFPPCDPCQPKGADRKQKTDREKMEKRAPQEKEKYQPSYETTILTEVFTQNMKVFKVWNNDLDQK